MSGSRYWWLGPALRMPFTLLLFVRGNWTPRFPRAWRGRRVTVCAHGRMHTIRMGRIARDHFDNWTLEWEDEHNGPPPRTFYFKDEGVTWVMGWKGKQVDAFKVTVALRAAA